MVPHNFFKKAKKSQTNIQKNSQRNLLYHFPPYIVIFLFCFSLCICLQFDKRNNQKFCKCTVRASVSIYTFSPRERDKLRTYVNCPDKMKYSMKLSIYGYGMSNGTVNKNRTHAVIENTNLPIVSFHRHPFLCLFFLFPSSSSSRLLFLKTSGSQIKIQTQLSHQKTSVFTRCHLHYGHAILDHFAVRYNR